MSGMLDMLDQINKAARQLTQELKNVLSKLKIRLSVDDLMLLYHIYQQKKKQPTISPKTLAEQSQYVMQQIMYQIQSLETRNFLILDNNDMFLAHKNIYISKMELLEQMFNKIENELSKSKIKFSWKS